MHGKNTPSCPNTSAPNSLSNLKLVADQMLLNDFFKSGLSFSDASGRQVGRRRRNRARTSTWVCCCAAFPLDRQVCNGSSLASHPAHIKRRAQLRNLAAGVCLFLQNGVTQRAFVASGFGTRPNRSHCLRLRVVRL